MPSVHSLQDDGKETIAPVLQGQDLHHLVVDYLQVEDFYEVLQLLLVLLL